MATKRETSRFVTLLALVLVPCLLTTRAAAQGRDLIVEAPAQPSTRGQPAKAPQAGQGRPQPGQGARPSTAAQKVPAPPQGAYDVIEWVVLVCDPNQTAANAERMFQSTLPEFVGARRPAAPAESATLPSPAGVIRVVAGAGAADGEKVDVLVQCPSGRFLGTWPKGKGRPDRQLWEAYELSAQPPQALKELVPGHWFGALRETASLYLRRARAAERFLLYDVEVNYALPLRVSVGDKGAYQLSNNGPSPLHDVTVFKPQDGRWRSGGVEVMPAARGVAPATATAPATMPAGARPGVPAEIAVRMAQRRTGVGGPGVPAPAAPATVPSTQPVAGASFAAVSADSPAAEPAAALAAWGKRLESMGLAAADVPQILRILEKHALDKRRMTVVYRLDPAELDRLLPLEVTPTPRKTVRVGIVVARNIDPAVGDEIDQLIAQLANPSWEEREAASKQLADLGPAARPKLQAALKQKDVEVVWRAERLLQALETPTSPQRRR